MKRNLHFFAAAVATISLLASCAEEIIDETTPNEDSDVTVTVPSDGMVTITFKADYPNPVTEGTRTTIAEDGTVAWEVGDEITLYYMEDDSPASAPATALGEGAQAEFQVTIPEGVNEVYAVYPAGAGELTAEGVFKVKTGSVKNGSFEQANYAAAWAEVSADMNITFKNVVGLFRVKLPEGGIIQDGDVSHTIRSIAISGKKSELSFLGDVAVTVGNGTLSFSDPENALTEAMIELDSETINAGYAYIPSLPVTSEDGLAFRFMNTEDQYLPAAVTKDDKAITLDRGHLKPVDTACESVIFDWYFAETPLGDGKSAGSPAGVAKFQKLLNDSQYLYGERRLDGARLNLAAGKYILTETLNIKGVEEGNVTIVGSGQNATIIDGNSALRLISYSAAADLCLNDLTLQNGKTTSEDSEKRGAGIFTLDATGTLVLKNCTLSNNVATGANSGAIFLATGAEMTNCKFLNNSANAGAAFAITGASTGDVIINGCLFDGNECAQSNTGGAAILHSANTNIFINRSVFKNNMLTPSQNGLRAVAIEMPNNGFVGLYNCTFNNNTTTEYNATVVRGKKYIIANCTFLEADDGRATGGIVCNKAAEDHQTTLVNTILTHGGATASHVSFGIESNKADYNHIDMGYNLIKWIGGTNFTEALNDATTYSGDNVLADTFGWDYARNDTYYPWNGDVSMFEGYQNCKLSDVEELIKKNANGENFWNWLKSIKVGSYDATQVDIRGELRDPELMWPGSYQGTL